MARSKQSARGKGAPPKASPKAKKRKAGAPKKSGKATETGRAKKVYYAEREEACQPFHSGNFVVQGEPETIDQYAFYPKATFQKKEKGELVGDILEIRSGMTVTRYRSQDETEDRDLLLVAFRKSPLGAVQMILAPMNFAIEPSKDVLKGPVFKEAGDPKFTVEVKESVPSPEYDVFKILLEYEVEKDKKAKALKASQHAKAPNDKKRILQLAMNDKALLVDKNKRLKIENEDLKAQLIEVEKKLVAANAALKVHEAYINQRH